VLFRFLVSLDLTETKEKQWKQDEELLKHSLGRVALAASGIDQNLDQQLKALRKLLRKDNSYDNLQQTVSSISRTVKSLDENNEKKLSSADMLTWLVDHVDLPKKYHKHARKLKKQLATLEINESRRSRI